MYDTGLEDGDWTPRADKLMSFGSGPVRDDNGAAAAGAMGRQGVMARAGVNASCAGVAGLKRREPPGLQRGPQISTTLGLGVRGLCVGCDETSGVCKRVRNLAYAQAD